VEDSFVDVGPVLFPEEVEAVDEVAGEPALTYFGPGAILRWVVEAADPCRSAGAYDLREIEHLVSVVCSADEDTGNGIPCAFAEAAVAKGVEAAILSKGDGAEAADHEVFIGGVGEGVPVVARVASGALMKLGVGVAVHGDAGLDASDEERGVVEAVLCGEGQLFFGRLGRQLGVSRDGAEVGHDAEDALGLLGAVGADGVGIVCLLRWLGCLGGLRVLRVLGGLRILNRAGSIWQFSDQDRLRET